MNESVEQAATVEGWKARARREAAAIIAEAMPNVAMQDYSRVVTLVAVGWLQGANYGAHDAVALMDEAFAGMRAEL
jgi:hypothetical protein